jgi:glutaredoxin
MSHTTIKLYGTNWCSDCKRSKKFLGEQRIHYEFINIEEDSTGQAFVQKVQNGGLTIPNDSPRFAFCALTSGRRFSPFADSSANRERENTLLSVRKGIYCIGVRNGPAKE